MRTIQKSPVLPSEHVVIERHGQLGGEGPTVYVYADVLDELMFHGAYRDEPSLSLLLGGSYDGPAGPFVEVVGFCASQYVADLASASEQVGLAYRRILEDAEPDSVQVLGWSCATEGSDALMDLAALRLHLTWFNFSQHIFLSIDPAAKTYGFYRRSVAGGMVNVGFNLIRNQKPQSTNPEEQ